MSYINIHHRSTVVPALSPEEIRQHRLITNSTVIDYLVPKLEASNQLLAIDYRRLFRNHNFGVTLYLLGKTIPPGLHTSNTLLASLLTTTASYARSDFREISGAIFAQNPELQEPIQLFSPREENICTKCGVRAHLPCECIYYRCSICDTDAPGHIQEECPLRQEHLEIEDPFILQTPPPPTTAVPAEEYQGTEVSSGRPSISRPSIFPSSTETSTPPSPISGALRSSQATINGVSSTRGTTASLRRSLRLQLQNQVRFDRSTTRTQDSLSEISSPSPDPQELGEEYQPVVQQEDPTSQQPTVDGNRVFFGQSPFTED